MIIIGISELNLNFCLYCNKTSLLRAPSPDVLHSDARSKSCYADWGTVCWQNCTSLQEQLMAKWTLNHTAEQEVSLGHVQVIVFCWNGDGEIIFSCWALPADTHICTLAPADGWSWGWIQCPNISRECLVSSLPWHICLYKHNVMFFLLPSWNFWAIWASKQLHQIRMFTLMSCFKHMGSACIYPCHQSV